MEITIEIDDAITVVSVFGKMNAANCGELEDALANIVIDGTTIIILSLEGLSYISSAGLRVLLNAAQSLHGKGKFVLCSLNEDVKEIIEMSGFSHFMNIYQDIEEAKSNVRD